MPPTEPNDEEQAQQLPQDNQTPFQPAAPNPDPTGNTTDPVVAAAGSDLPDDHPATDSAVDSTEVYDEGVAGAAEATDASAQPAVTDYNPSPSEDQPATQPSDDTTDDKTDDAL